MLFKTRRVKHVYNVYTAQKNIWSNALEVSDKIIDRVSKRKNIFGENFVDYIQSMRGQINSVQRHEYKYSQHQPRRTVLDDLEQFFNRFANLYLDTDITNDLPSRAANLVISMVFLFAPGHTAICRSSPIP